MCACWPIQLIRQLDPHLLADPLPPDVVEELSLLPPPPALQSKVRLTRSRDDRALRLLPATTVFDEPTV